MDQLIAKIKELKNVYPERKWLKQTKAMIMAQEEQKESSFDFSWLKRNSFLALPTALAVLLLAVFFYNHQGAFNPTTVSVDVETLESIGRGLKAVESEILRTTSSLEKIGQPAMALKVEKMVFSTLEKGSDVVVKTKKMVENPQAEEEKGEVFAALSGVEDAADRLEGALKEMEETYLEKQKELARQLIEEWEGQELAPEKETLLEEAKTYYHRGDFTNSLAKLMELSR